MNPKISSCTLRHTVKISVYVRTSHCKMCQQACRAFLSENKMSHSDHWYKDVLVLHVADQPVNMAGQYSIYGKDTKHIWCCWVWHIGSLTWLWCRLGTDGLAWHYLDTGLAIPCWMRVVAMSMMLSCQGCICKPSSFCTCSSPELWWRWQQAGD